MNRGRKAEHMRHMVMCAYDVSYHFDSSSCSFVYCQLNAIAFVLTDTFHFHLYVHIILLKLHTDISKIILRICSLQLQVVTNEKSFY